MLQLPDTLPGSKGLAVPECVVYDIALSQCCGIMSHVSLCSNHIILFVESRRGLVERLAAGEHILCAEGYLLALSSRGYIAHGVWVPEFVLEQPEVLRSVHYEFVHAGTDVTEAYQVKYSSFTATLIFYPLHLVLHSP